MTSINEYFDFLEGYAADHLEVLHHAEAAPHFFRADIDEFENAYKRGMHFPAVAALNPTLDTSMQSITNVRLVWRGALMIMERISKPGDFGQRQALEHKCLGIARDFMLRMINDRQQYAPNQKQHILAGLDVGSFNLELIPNRYTALTGVLLQFTFNFPLGRFDASKWDGVAKYSIEP